MKLPPIEILLDKLQSIHDRAVILDTPRSFFLTLYEYMEVFDKDERLEPINQTIRDLREKEFVKTKELEKIAIEETMVAFKKIKKYVGKIGFSNQQMTQLIYEVEAYEKDDGRIESTAGPVTGRHGSVMRMLICLIDEENDEHKTFARSFGITNDEGIVIQWNFAPSYFELEKEKKYIERLQDTKIWYSWDKLVFFFGIYRDYEKWRQQQIEQKRFFNVMGLDDMFKELQDVMSYKNDPKRYLRTFDVSAYKTYLQKIHSYTKEVLLTAQQSLDENNTQKNWSYDPTSGVLNLNGKFVRFKKNGFRAKLLELLSKSLENKEKLWSWDEVYEVIESTESMKDSMGKKEQRQVYEASKGITEYIAKEISLNDFLTYDTKTVCINPSYL